MVTSRGASRQNFLLAACSVSVALAAVDIPCDALTVESDCQQRRAADDAALKEPGSILAGSQSFGSMRGFVASRFAPSNPLVRPCILVVALVSALIGLLRVTLETVRHTSALHEHLLLVRGQASKAAEEDDLRHHV
mmetsp:Transcript_21187/g.38676  ORF Transcript_21187/g.38676 Transcript_21187/m.38676 type:complete len:136 (-) Transcript_21187:62-469(-)